MPTSPTVLLFLAANPGDSDVLQLDLEAREIRDRVSSATFRDCLDIRTRWAVRTSDILDAINDHRPGIVHFSGHGEGKGIVIDAGSDTSRELTSDHLSRLFSTVTRDVRCVVLNACRTDALAVTLSLHIDATIGMAEGIGDVAARVFAAALYRSLASGRSLVGAYQQAIAAMVVEGTGYENVPQLHARDGVSLELLVFASAALQPKAAVNITLVLDANLSEIDPRMVGRLMGELRLLSDDLRLEIGRRSDGSVRLGLETTVAGARKLRELHASGRLTEVCGLTVIGLEGESMNEESASARVDGAAREPDIESLLRVVRTMVDSLHKTSEEAISLLGLSESRATSLRKRWMDEVAQPVHFARVISNLKGGKRDWAKQWDPAQGYYWRRLRTYLIDKLERSDADIRSLDDATDRVLAHLEDPRPTGPAQFRVQGLVVGYVQSGKTANFSALIAKAADAGYKLVIVLSGIHNELRRQTQLRLNREFGIGDEGKLGVGEPEFGKRWVAITQPEKHGDFREGTFNAAVLQGNERVLAVVKKNAMVLRRLITWMRGHVPPDMPVLVIDDEADQASINTGGNRPGIAPEDIDDLVDLAADDRDHVHPGDEIAPAVINGLIRELLQSFGRVSFVAYTATPFANVLIGHDAIDREWGQDLYPRDFIVSLPKPFHYFGAERLFGRDSLPGEDAAVPPLDVIRYIPDAEKGFLVPVGRAKADTFKPRMPPSLRAALLDFILALAARYHRGMSGKPACMLVHTHYRTVVQFRMRDLSVASIMGPAFGKFATLMGPPDRQGHGATRTVA